MAFAATSMEMEAISLSEVTQEQKTKYHKFSLTSGSYTLSTYGHKEGDTVDIEVYLRVQGWRGVRIEKLPIGHYADYLGDKIIYTPNPHDTQFAHVTNMHTYLLPSI